MNYKKIPKIELHRHLEGNFSPGVLYKMAQKYGLDYPQDYDEFKKSLQFPKDSPPDFLLFLSKFFNGWYGDLHDVDEVVYHSMYEMANEDNLKYLEVRFNPLHYAVRKGFDPAETLNVVIAALDRAVSERKIYVRYLMTFNRGFQKQEEMIETLKRFQAEADLSHVVGIDLAGDEVKYPPELFSDFFDYVQQQNFDVTIHGGEVSGPDQVWTCIRDNHAKRIGHGVAITKDEALLEYVKKQAVAIESCPISNYQTGAWADTKNHPIRDFLRKGLLVTLNSDDPTVQNTELYDEYQIAHESMGLSMDELKQLNINAIHTAFLSPTEKAALLKRFEDDWQDFLLVSDEK
ncbi:MAG: adenosine deaminase [Spirochaetia bacterium]